MDRFELEQKIWERRELQRLSQHMMRRRMVIRGMKVHPGREAYKRDLLERYNLDIQQMIGEINLMGDEIYAAQEGMRA